MSRWRTWLFKLIARSYVEWAETLQRRLDFSTEKIQLLCELDDKNQKKILALQSKVNRLLAARQKDESCLTAALKRQDADAERIENLQKLDKERLRSMSMQARTVEDFRQALFNAKAQLNREATELRSVKRAVERSLKENFGDRDYWIQAFWESATGRDSCGLYVHKANEMIELTNLQPGDLIVVGRMPRKEIHAQEEKSDRTRNRAGDESPGRGSEASNRSDADHPEESQSNRTQAGPDAGGE